MKTKEKQNIPIEALNKAMLIKEAIASIALDDCTQCGTIEPNTKKQSPQIKPRQSSEVDLKTGSKQSNTELRTVESQSSEDNLHKKQQDLEKDVLKKIEETDNKIKSFMELRGFTKDTFNHYWQIINNDIALERISLVYAGDLYEAGIKFAKEEILKEIEDYNEKRHGHCKNSCESEEYDAINNLLKNLKEKIK